MLSYIMESDSQKKHNEPMRRLAEISDHHGGRLLCDHLLLSSFRDTIGSTRSEYSRAQSGIQEMITSEQRDLLLQRVEEVNADQKAVFDGVMETLHTQRSDNSTTTLNEKILFL